MSDIVSRQTDAEEGRGLTGLRRSLSLSSNLVGLVKKLIGPKKHKSEIVQSPRAYQVGHGSMDYSQCENQVQFQRKMRSVYSYRLSTIKEDLAAERCESERDAKSESDGRCCPEAVSDLAIQTHAQKTVPSDESDETLCGDSSDSGSCRTVRPHYADSLEIWEWEKDNDNENENDAETNDSNANQEVDLRVDVFDTEFQDEFNYHFESFMSFNPFDDFCWFNEFMFGEENVEPAEEYTDFGDEEYFAYRRQRKLVGVPPDGYDRNGNFIVHLLSTETLHCDIGLNYVVYWKEKKEEKENSYPDGRRPLFNALKPKQPLTIHEIDDVEEIDRSSAKVKKEKKSKRSTGTKKKSKSQKAPKSDRSEKKKKSPKAVKPTEKENEKIELSPDELCEPSKVYTLSDILMNENEEEKLLDIDINIDYAHLFSEVMEFSRSQGKQETRWICAFEMPIYIPEVSTVYTFSHRLGYRYQIDLDANLSMYEMQQFFSLITSNASFHADTIVRVLMVRYLKTTRPRNRMSRQLKALDKYFANALGIFLSVTVMIIYYIIFKDWKANQDFSENKKRFYFF